MKKYLLIIFIALGLAACGDPAPTEIYEAKFVLEALLLVDEPISGITLIQTQPLNKEFIFDSAMIRNASIVIRGDGQEFPLKYRSKSEGKRGYYALDTTYLVKAETAYEIEVLMADGNIITGKTVTPARNNWIIDAPDRIQFPIDSLTLPPGDSLVWSKTQSAALDYYLFSIAAIDTAEYGIYLDPPTSEKNRRIERPWRDDDFYQEVANIRPNPGNKSPIIWSTFRWFGLQQVSVYTPDFNFLRWYLQVQTTGTVDPRLSSVEGAIGYFGSAYALRDTFFLIKNQP